MSEAGAAGGGRQLRVRALCGSLRAESFNAALRRALPELAPAGMTIEPLDGIGALPLYDGDIQDRGFPPEVEAMGAAIRAADGIVICSPEYNHSVSGVLKNALDWLSRLKDQPFSGKPVAVQSASTGGFGGVRGQLALNPVLDCLNAFVLTRPAVLVANAATKFDGAGSLTDAATREAVSRQLAAFDALIRRVGD